MPAAVGIPSHSSCRRPSESPRTRHSGPPIRHSGEGRNPGLAYGLQMTRKHLHQSAPRFSHLGVPAPAGTSDWYESMSRTPIRDEWYPRRPLVSSCRLPSESPRTRHPAPQSSFRRRPESRGAEGWQNWHSNASDNNTPIHLPRPAGNSPPRKGAKAARNRKKRPVSQKEEVLMRLECPPSLAISVPLASDQIQPYCLR